MTNRPRITRFEVRGFRSCRRTVFLPALGLTSLVGVNASGKSNLLQAILLLTQIAVSRPSRRTRPGTVPCELFVNFDVRGRHIAYRASLLLAIESGGKEEIEVAKESWNFKSITGRDKWLDLPMRYFASPRRGRLPRRPDYYYYGRLYLPHHMRQLFSRHRRTPDYLRAIADFCSGIEYYSASRFTNPTTCPSSIEIDADGTLTNPYNIPPSVEFLYDLYRCWDTERDLYERYMSVVGVKGIGLIDRINWKAVKAPTRDMRVRPGGTVVREMREQLIVIPTMVVKGFRLAPSQLSEGTFRSLALIFHLLAAKSELILLEEPEVCVHHGLLSSLIEIIKSCASDKQVIFSTHSDFVLDALAPDDVQMVRYSPKQGTVVTRLPETISRRDFAALKRYLGETGNLGEYWRQRGFA